MRLDAFLTPEALALTISSWPRFEIENAIERLIEVLDIGDALDADLEPADEMTGIGDGLAGDQVDAED